MLVALFAFLALATKSQALLYWANPNHEGLNRAKLDGTSVEKNFLNLEFNTSMAVAVDAQRVYWDDTTSFVPPRANIGRANVNATGIDEAFIQDLPYDQIWDIEAGGGKIYWLGGVNGAQWIGRADLDGSSVEPHFIPTDACGGGDSCGQASDLALDAQGGQLFWDASVYDEVEETYVPTIARATTAGASYDVDFVRPENLDVVDGLAVSDSHLYWGDGYDTVVNEEIYTVGTVGRSTTAGGSVNTRFVDPGVPQQSSYTRDVGVGQVGTVDDSYIYFDVDWDSSFIGRAGVGGTPIDLNLIPEEDDPGGRAAWSMAVDSLQTAPARPVIDRTVSLGYSQKKRKFKGGIASSDADCESEQEVSVFRRRPGDDDRVGGDHSNQLGSFSVAKRKVSGKYYAQLDTSWAPDGDCAVARSGIVRV